MLAFETTFLRSKTPISWSKEHITKLQQDMASAKERRNQVIKYIGSRRLVFYFKNKPTELKPNDEYYVYSPGECHRQELDPATNYDGMLVELEAATQHNPPCEEKR